VGVSGAVTLADSTGAGALLLAPRAAGLARAAVAHLPGTSRLRPATVCKGAFLCTDSVRFRQEYGAKSIDLCLSLKRCLEQEEIT